MNETPIKNCSTCAHSIPGDWESKTLKEMCRFCKLCNSHCSDVNNPYYGYSDWICVKHNQWTPRPPEPPTLWQQIGKAILAKLTTPRNHP